MRRAWQVVPAVLFGLAGALQQPAAAATLHILIRNLAFRDVPAIAHIGDVVAWSNMDFIEHTATARDGSFNLLLPAGKTVRSTLEHAGKIGFYCRFHPQMTGMITVLP